MYVGDCIVWMGSLTQKGYGNFYANGATTPAHRFAYQESFGPIPKGLVINHLCTNTACVNPGHLQACTQRENLYHPNSKFPNHASSKKPYRRKTHCKRGHEYTEANTRRKPSGGRSCRACARDLWRKRYHTPGSSNYHHNG